MKALLSNRKVVIAAGIVLLLVIFGIIIFIAPRFLNQSTTQQAVAQPTEVPILTLSPEAIGLSLTEDAAGQNAIIEVSDTQGITAISFELDYTGKPSAGMEAVPRGAVGDLVLTKSPVIKKIPFGTCSDVCHYDSDISGVKVILKVTKDDGKIYQVTKTLE